MASLPQSAVSSLEWSAEAMALVAQAKVLSGNKLERLVVRLQCLTGRSKDKCWRYVIQYGIKEAVDHRRWTEGEIDVVREELVKHSIEEVAKKVNRTPKAIRSLLQRHGLSVREIRCDRFSIESLSIALRVRKTEIHFWIRQGWLQATVDRRGRKPSYIITPEALTLLYKNHLPELLRRGNPNQPLFEAYLQYCFSPKHTVGEQLLDVRRDKKERASYAALHEHSALDEKEEDDDEDDEGEEGYRIDVPGNFGAAKEIEGFSE
jgi:hypothetical protein